MRDELFIILGKKRYKVNKSWAKFKHNESFGLISDVSIDSNNNGLAAGPLTIASGVTLTINGELSVV